MKKLIGIILAGAMALSMGTQAFAADTNNGNHYGWENGKHNPHKSEVTPPKNVEETDSYDNLPFGVTDEATALDKHRVDLMADETNIQGIEADFNSGSNTAYLDIIGIKVLDGQLVYVISNDINPNNFPVSSEAAHLLVNTLGYEQLHFMLPQEFEISSLFYVEGVSVFMTDYKQPLL
ncbi:hypothetical protein [Metabacillus bambusae]|uniref:SLAP domain-containing protein n=1 Tax=Metabacillus bambusae TaxID=2795218 RepID=A0ABS3N0C8_9BACI|nr:hypothetical protein [Metabacillus bambusae]MBO1511526.1 hypothetical protein [Metabacillus bambusae]